MSWRTAKIPGDESWEPDRDSEGQVFYSGPKSRAAEKRDASIGYTLLGYYLASYHPCPRRSVSALVLSAGFFLAFGGTWAASAAAGKPDGHFLEGMGLGIFLVALGEWGLCRTISLPEWVGRLTVRFSNASFCVYLTHVFFLQAFTRHGIRAVEGSVLLMVPVVSVLIIACCCGLYALLSRMPGIQKWLA